MGEKRTNFWAKITKKIVKSSPAIKKNWDVMEKNNYDFRVQHTRIALKIYISSQKHLESWIFHS